MITIDHINTTQLDSILTELQASKERWVQTRIDHKIALLHEIRIRLRQVAQEWVDVSIQGKNIETLVTTNPAVAGEEWSSGPWALGVMLNALIESLTLLKAGKQPAIQGVRTLTTAVAEDQVIAEVFPANVYDTLLTNGIRAEVWMQPELSEARLPQEMAAFYRQQQAGKRPDGQVALILGAGNINSIPPLDALCKLFVEGQVVMLKLNPVNEYIGQVLETIFRPLIDLHYLGIVYGGADVGNYLVQHAHTDTVHITGSARTHDIIVYGSGEEGATRKANNTPILDKPISSELGGISPTIVVPGPWTNADVRFQAENIVSQKLHNNGCNCIASQVLVLPAGWDKNKLLLSEITRHFQQLHVREHYYPGAEERLQQAIDAANQANAYVQTSNGRVLITGVDASNPDTYSFNHEFFTTALAQTYISTTGVGGVDAGAYLENTIRFANEQLDGTLGAQIIIHPVTIRELGPRFEELLAQLRYGTIGINIWSGIGFFIPQVAWGAYPEHTLGDIQSGIGFVHNSLMFTKPQKNVIYGPFWEAPRTFRHRKLGLLPKPPWFVTNKQAHVTTKRLTEFTLTQDQFVLPGIFWSALQG
ncbi:MAG: aldehyde dehydrogenase family protein [Chloroflexota bacterium]